MLNQRGFSPLHFILTLFIVGIVGFTGWYVYDSKEKTDKSLNIPNSTIEKPEQKDEQKDEYQGWKEHAGRLERLSFRYPADWKKEDNGVQSESNESTTLCSPKEISAENRKWVGCLSFGVYKVVQQEFPDERCSSATKIDTVPTAYKDLLILAEIKNNKTSSMGLGLSVQDIWAGHGCFFKYDAKNPDFEVEFTFKYLVTSEDSARQLVLDSAQWNELDDTKTILKVLRSVKYLK